MIKSRNYGRKFGITLLTLVVPVFLLAAAGGQAFAEKQTFGLLYNDGEIVRTLVPPSAFPHEGRDPIYVITNGVEGQLGVASVAPGDSGYHGGAWAVYLVSFDGGVSPYLLTSEDDVLDAQADGDITITRAASMDFRCPIQP